MVEGTLVPSPTSGCYAIDHAEGFEITGGQQCEILLAGNWIPGKVEQSSESVGNYHIARGNAVGLFHGYYFTVGDGSVCGICTGMKVRIPGSFLMPL